MTATASSMQCAPSSEVAVSEGRTERLMIPGPVPLSPGVLAALASPPRPHYGEEWAAIWNGALAHLAALFGTTGTVLNIPGSGSAGLDAAANSVVGPGDRVLVSTNGYHGNRLASIAAARGADVVRVEARWGDPVLPEQFAELAAAGPPPRLAIVTHVETTTGVINPVPEIVEVVRRWGTLAMVDAVASLGGTEFHMDAWGVDIACASSQKCLGSTPGLAQVALSARAEAAIAERAEAPRSWALDLAVWLDYHRKWTSWHPYPVTVPTGTTLALVRALDELAADGLETRFAHYRSVGEYLKKRVQEAGLELLAPAKYAAPVVTAFRVDGRSSNALNDYLLTQHGVHAGAGFGELEDRAIRVGHMSPRITNDDVDALAEGIAAFLRTS
jgi:alanine-glyoxylate transaminase/serine-glyoxylate transaminase/serine-pyruvate transaminase